jgi:hypothetical protein
MLRLVALVRTEVSEGRSAYIVRVTRIELGTTLAVTIHRSTRRNIPEDGIFHSHRRENLKPYIASTSWAQQWIRNVFPVRYELRFYIPEKGTLL